MASLARSAYDGSHVKGVSAYVLIHPDSDRRGKIAGRIVANHSDNPAGSVCTATVHVWSGPLEPMPATTGKAGGYGYDKLSAAVHDAISRANWTDKPKIPDFAGAGMSAAARWFESFGYVCEGIIG